MVVKFQNALVCMELGVVYKCLGAGFQTPLNVWEQGSKILLKYMGAGLRRAIKLSKWQIAVLG